MQYFIVGTHVRDKGRKIYRASTGEGAGGGRETCS